MQERLGRSWESVVAEENSRRIDLWEDDLCPTRDTN